MLSEAWHAMGANRLRTFLTMLGMVIGVGAVVLMMAIGEGAQRSIKKSIDEDYLDAIKLDKMYKNKKNI